MIVFFDTTELRQNPRMHGVKWEKIRRYFEQGDNGGFLTQLVIDEVTTHVREDLSRTAGLLAKCERTVTRVAGEDHGLKLPNIDIEKQVAAYKSFIMRRLQELALTVVGNDSASVDALIYRALNRRKPFDANGRAGFRDAVQWEVMLSVIEKSVDSILFVTSNEQDFGLHGSLASELQDDLLKIERAGAVTICKGIERFVNEFVEPMLERLDELAIEIAEGQYKSFQTDDFIMGLMDSINDVIKREVAYRGLDSLDYIVRSNFYDPTLADLDENFSISDVDVFRINEENIAITISVEFEGSITCQEDATFGPTEALEPHYEEFTGDAVFLVRCGAVVNERTGDVIEEDVESVSVKLGHNWPYIEYD